ncbi:MAG: hypothetical protein HN981_02125 [Candidatus Pacebacteria bacterium]|jgi:hypothetical protein|nr:hypothetical protein [Candidatus Paceibacterota bacterium]MBT6921169.1 hypothetical protein [Candidatus Paceibacterota bacterium]
MLYGQTLQPVIRFVKSYSKRNKNASLSTLFKNARKLEKISYFGDWPIIQQIVIECARKNKFFSPKEITKAYRLSNDPHLKRQRIDSYLVATLSNEEELKDSIREENK